jgi:thymidine kinase
MSYGRLTVICGPMYAGKTTELLKRVLWAKSGQNRRVKVYKPSFDDRYATESIVSHDGLRVEAISVRSADEITAEKEAWIERDGRCVVRPDCVFIDEVQFFTDPHFDGDIVEVVRALLGKGVDVVVTGLDMDWQGQPFSKTAQLGAMADEMVKITANCTVCGRPATKTHKKSGEGAQVELGALDKYEARCNDHWGDN